MNSFIVYDHISPSGKHYIGQTCRKPEYRWNDGKGYLGKNVDGSYNQPLFARAILKYGWSNFEHKVLFKGLSQVDADMIEEDLIHYYTKEGLSYNLRPGGKNCSGWHMSEKGRENISKAKRGEKNPNYGKRPSDYVIKRCVEQHSIPVVQYSIDGIIKEWASAKEAERVLHICSWNICRVCKGERNTAGGFFWKYQK